VGCKDSGFSRIAQAVPRLYTDVYACVHSLEGALCMGELVGLGWVLVRDAPTDNQMPSVVTSSVSLQNASSMTRRKSSTAQQDPACKRLLAKLATKGVDVQNDDTWVRLSMFLQIVGKPDNHAGRFVDPRLDFGKNKKCWKAESGKHPQVKKDWMKLKGHRGGGTGDGVHHVRLSFLKNIYLRKLVPHC
jgi:hypothetical protein